MSSPIFKNPDDASHGDTDQAGTARGDSDDTFVLPDKMKSERTKNLSIATGGARIVLALLTIPIALYSVKQGNFQGTSPFSYIGFVWCDPLIFISGVLGMAAGLNVTLGLVRAHSMFSMLMAFIATMPQLIVAGVGVMVDGKLRNVTDAGDESDTDDELQNMLRTAGNDAHPLLAVLLLVACLLKMTLCFVAFGIHYDAWPRKGKRRVAETIAGPLPPSYFEWKVKTASVASGLLRIGLAIGGVVVALECLWDGGLLGEWGNQIIAFYWTDLGVFIGGVFGIFAGFNITARKCSLHSRLSYGLTMLPIVQATMGAVSLDKYIKPKEKTDMGRQLCIITIVIGILKALLCLAAGYLHTKSWRTKYVDTTTGEEIHEDGEGETRHDNSPIKKGENPEQMPLAPPPNYDMAVGANA